MVSDWYKLVWTDVICHCIVTSMACQL